MQSRALEVSPEVSLEVSKEAYSVKLASGTELKVRALKYTNANETKIPVVLIFGGFEGAAHVLELFEPTFPVYLVSFDYPYSPPRRFEFPQSLKHVPEAKRAIHDTIEGIGAVAKSLLERQDLDATRISLVGASFGAPFVALAAANDPMLYQRLVLIHGFTDIRATLENRLRMAWERKLGDAADPVAWAVSTILWWYMDVPDPGPLLRTGLDSHHHVLVIKAENDRFIPEVVTQNMIHHLVATRARVTVRTTNGDHLMPGSTKLIQDLLEITAHWMKKRF